MSRGTVTRRINGLETKVKLSYKILSSHFKDTSLAFWWKHWRIEYRPAWGCIFGINEDLNITEMLGCRERKITLLVGRGYIISRIENVNVQIESTFQKPWFILQLLIVKRLYIYIYDHEIFCCNHHAFFSPFVWYLELHYQIVYTTFKLCLSKQKFSANSRVDSVEFLCEVCKLWDR